MVIKLRFAVKIWIIISFFFEIIIYTEVLTENQNPAYFLKIILIKKIIEFLKEENVF
jgi:hypothetical protein